MGSRAGQFPSIPDEALVVGALLGDLSAFDELVRRFRGAVTAVAEQVLGCPDAARDVAQESFLLAFKALPQLDDADRFAPWICAIARHRARRVARREGRSQATAPSEIDRLILEQSKELAAPSAGLERSQERDAVRTALGSLGAELKIVLLLYYYEEWPVRRIAAFLALPASTVKQRLHRGRELLRRRLTDGTEDERNERTEWQRNGSATNPPPAAGNGADRPRRGPHGGPGARRGGLRAPVQPVGPGGDRRHSARVLPAPAGTSAL